jgi:heat shock protein HslJ
MPRRAVSGGMRSLVALATFLAGCGLIGGVDPTGYWQLESGVLEGQPIPILAGHRITLHIEEGNAGGQSACNYYGTTDVAIDGSNISFGDFMQTLIGCDGAVGVSEQMYLAALGRVQRISSGGPRSLILLGPGAELSFSAVELVDPSEFVDRVWILDSLVEGEVFRNPGGDSATLELRVNGAFEGSTGCRTFEGQWITAGDEVRVTAIDMFGDCPLALADQDGHVVSVIGGAFQPQIDGDRLTLRARGEIGLVYRPEAASD